MGRVVARGWVCAGGFEFVFKSVVVGFWVGTLQEVLYCSFMLRFWIL